MDTFSFVLGAQSWGVFCNSHSLSFPLGTLFLCPPLHPPQAHILPRAHSEQRCHWFASRCFGSISIHLSHRVGGGQRERGSRVCFVLILRWAFTGIRVSWWGGVGGRQLTVASCVLSGKGACHRLF